MDILPWADIGVSVIIFTVIIRLILFPLSKQSVATQIAMREIEPEVAKIKKNNKDNQEKQARELMALYKEKNIHPFSGVLLIFIQLPILFGLYFIFLRSGLPTIDTSILYPFVHAPETISILFLGLVDVTKRSLLFALLTALTQFVSAWIISPKTQKTDGGGFAQDFQRGMQMQMKYVFPIIVGFIAYSLSAIIALYWITTNLFTIGQEFYMRRKRLNPALNQINAQKL